MSNPGTTNLEAWWSLNEMSGTRYDAHGSNDLTEENSVLYGTGKHSLAADFELDNSERLYVADNASLSMGDINFWMGGWIKPETISGDHYIVNKSYNNTTDAIDREYSLRISSTGIIQFIVASGVALGGVSTTSSATVGAWSFIVAYHDFINDLIGISFDGGAFVTTSYSGGSWNSNGDFNMANHGTTPQNFYDGLIDNFFVYKGSVPSDATASWLYNSGRGRIYQDVAGIVRPVMANLVSWWGLNEESGTRYDSHGSNDLADGNTVLYGTGVKGNAADFELANTEYLWIADNASLSFGDEPFTIGAWVKLESTGGTMQSIISKYDIADNDREYRLIYDTTSNKFEFAISSDGTANDNIEATSFGTPSTGIWYFVLGWHDPTADTINIQVNGGIVDNKAYTLGCNDNVANFHISGQEHGTGRASWFDGVIDEVFLYDSVLTSAQRAWLYNSREGRAFDELTVTAQHIMFFT